MPKTTIIILNRDKDNNQNTTNKNTSTKSNHNKNTADNIVGNTKE